MDSRPSRGFQHLNFFDCQVENAQFEIPLEDVLGLFESASKKGGEGDDGQEIEREYKATSHSKYVPSLHRTMLNPVNLEP